jgi:hypothetical protein
MPRAIIDPSKYFCEPNPYNFAVSTFDVVKLIANLASLLPTTLVAYFELYCELEGPCIHLLKLHPQPPRFIAIGERILRVVQHRASLGSATPLGAGLKKARL